MRAKGYLIGFIGLGLVASIACSRNANQQNFIGADCKAQADCPAELLCVNNKCWEPCRPDGTCPNAGETCILNACVPGGDVGGGTDGGGGQEGGGGQDTDGGGTPPGGNKGDGILARANLPTESDMAQGGFGLDDTCVAWTVKVPDGFGNSAMEVHAAPLTSTNAPDQKLVNVAPTSGRIDGVECANGYAYWVEVPEASPSGTLYRRKIDASGGAETILTTATMGMGGAGPLGHVGDDLFFVDTSNNLRRYDSTAGTLDATSYGTATIGSLAARTGNTIFWLYNTAAPSATPWEVWSAQVGSAGATTGVAIPKPGGGPGYLAMGASGTSVFVAIASVPKGSLTRIDTTAAPSGNPAQAYSASLEGGGSTPPVAFSGAFGFVNDYSNGGATAQVMRVNMLDGSKTQIGTSISPGGARPLRVSATTVYWLEPSFDGQSTNLMKKPKN